ncbi:MAG: serine O-acetyltransferase [Lentimonas sp.]|jgi:serine O-acetyltransferase
MFEIIKSDISRKRELYHHHGSWFVRWIKIFIDPGGLALLVYRYGNWINQLKIPVLRQLLRLSYILLKLPIVLGFGIYIPSKATIGKGFVIHNMNGIFISTGVIGDNCTVQQGVTIGAIRPNKWDGKPRPPRIGNNVYLGAGAKILGDVTIGENVVVGANSVVLTNTPDNVTVMGAPARIISRNASTGAAYGMPSPLARP